MVAFSVMPGMLMPLSGAPSYTQGLNTLTLLFTLGLGVVLGVSIGACFFAVQHRRRRNRLQRPPVVAPARIAPRAQPRWPATPWAGPSQWLAIRDAHPETVQAALRLHNPTACSWEEGLTAAHEQKLFIAAPVAGWTLVLGSSLPEPGEDVDACFHFLRQLSLKVGEVQFFRSHRGLQHHAWIRAERGRIVRAYAWGGNVLWNEGAMTSAERELCLTCFDYGEGPLPLPWGQTHPLVINTERVPALAGRWSVNPATLDVRFGKPAYGIAGRLSSSQAI